MSLAASKRNSKREYTKSIGGTRPDVGHYVRSSWEANISRLLKLVKFDYLYEAATFKLTDPKGNVIRYTPDFKLNNFFIEVKGWWDNKSKLKRRLLDEQYPDVKIIYISEKEYKELEKSYAKFIPEWEFKRRR